MTGSREGRAIIRAAAAAVMTASLAAAGLCGAPANARDETGDDPEPSGPGYARVTVPINVPIDGPAGGAGEPIREDLVYLEADEVLSDESTGQYIAHGDVEIRYGPRTLSADEIIVYQDSGRVLARGNIIILDDNGIVTFAEEAEFTPDLQLGVIEGAAARLPNEGKTGAAFAIRRAGAINELRRAFYTVCTPCTEDGEMGRPAWRLRARRVTQDENAQMLYYRDALLEVKGVPVLYLPYFAHADPSSERRTGFLLPYFGESSRTGQFFEQPFYWSMSSSQDLTLSPRFMTEANALLAFEHRKKFFSGGSLIQGSATHEQEFDDDGLKFGERKWRGHIFGNAEFALSDTWRWGLGVERVSDDLYFRRYEIDDSDQQRGIYRRGSKRLLSQLYLEGQSSEFYGSLAAMAFQGLRAGDDEDLFPVIAPLGEYRRHLSHDIFGGRLDGRLSTAVLERSEAEDSRRASAEFDWRRRFIGPGGVVAEPFVFGRADVYSIQDYVAPDGETVDDVISRELGYLGAEVSWPFGRTAGNIDVIVEPIASVVVAPYGGNDDRIPNVDSLITELDESNLFDPNRAPGFDIWEDGPRAMVGARAVARWNRTGEASLFLGQSYRTDHGIEFDPETGLAGTTSDLVGAAEFALDSRRRLAARFRLDESDYDIRRLDLDASYALGRASVSGKYLRFADDLATAIGRPSEELSFTTGLELTRNLGAYYRTTVDLDLDEARYAFLGVVYNIDCARLELIYKRDGTRDRALNEGDSIKLQFTLTTLGTFGSN